MYYCQAFFDVAFRAPAHWLEASHLDTVMCNLGNKNDERMNTKETEYNRVMLNEVTKQYALLPRESQSLRSPAALLSICSATSSLGQSQQTWTKSTAEPHQITPGHQLSTLH
jgi:hypothetical protein